MSLTEMNRLVIVGDLDADKTLLLYVMLFGRYPEVYVPTVLENYVIDYTYVLMRKRLIRSLVIYPLANQSYSLRIDSYPVEIAMWDTAMQEDYHRLRPLSYPDSDVILLCFKANNPTIETKRNILEKWMPELDHFCRGVPIILVGINAREGRRDYIFDNPEEQPQPVAEVDAEDSFVPFTIRKEIGSARYFFCNPRTGFGIPELTEYVRNHISLPSLFWFAY
jgi:small GTP-binding protein